MWIWLSKSENRKMEEQIKNKGIIDDAEIDEMQVEGLACM